MTVDKFREMVHQGLFLCEACKIRTAELVHRIFPGRLGGLYTPSNITGLCSLCHHCVPDHLDTNKKNEYYQKFKEYVKDRGVVWDFITLGILGTLHFQKIRYALLASDVIKDCILTQMSEDHSKKILKLSSKTKVSYVKKWLESSRKNDINWKNIN